MSEAKVSETCAAAAAAPSTLAVAPTRKERLLTSDEMQLMTLVREKLATLPAPAGPYLSAFVVRADAKLTHPQTDDAYRFIQFGHRFLREMRRLGENHPALLTVPDVPGLTFDHAVETALELLTWAAAQRGGKLVLTDDGTTIVLLADGISEAQSVRRRVLVVVQSNGSEPELAAAMKSHLVAHRREPRTRPALLTDLGDIRQKIHTLTAEVHAALAALKDGTLPEETERLLSDRDAMLEAERSLSPWAPSVQQVVLTLEQLLPRIDEVTEKLRNSVDARRLPKVQEYWGRPIQVLVLAMEYLYGAFLRHAAVVASDSVLEQLNRLLTAPAPAPGTSSTDSSVVIDQDELPEPAKGEEFEDAMDDVADAQLPAPAEG